MEPSYPDSTNTNPTAAPQPATPEPKKRWPFSGKVIIILVAVLVIVIVTIVFLVSSGGSKSGDSSDRSTIYTQREGFGDLDESIGDPMALISKASTKAAQYRGSAVVQPCALLSVSDIRGSGLKLTPALQPGAVNSNFLDGQSQQPIQPNMDDFGFPFPDNTNNCTYYLTDGERVTLTTYQDTYLSPVAVDREINRSFTAAPETSGVQTFQKKQADDEATTYLLRVSGVTNVLELNTANEAAKDKLLRALADHMKIAVNTPTPLQEYGYDSPIWSAGKVAKPCELFDAASVKTILGKEAGPIVNEKVGGVVGVIKSPISTSATLYNYVSGECDRRTAEAYTSNSNVIVRTDTYETEEGAKLILDYTRRGKFTKDLQEISPTIGDESFYADTASMEEAVVFRKGRVIVKMTYLGPIGSPTVPANERINAMRSVAEAAAQKLNDF
jgi:hypothetical protein